jgi:proteasome lid subunit RPN8/RPN11
MRTLLLSRPQQQALLEALDQVYPEEGCGFMAGRGEQVQALYPVENILHSPVAFEMEPQQQIAALLAMEAAGQQLLAIYHSHPHGPKDPSTSDVARAGNYPDALQVIVSLARRDRPQIGVFHVAEGVVTRAHLLVV